MESGNDKIKRLIDANFNRTREGLRVAEDFARFILDNQELIKALKNLRSEIGLIQSQYDFLTFRDTQNDKGTVLSSKIETKRHSEIDIVKANIKRVEESLRVLEEFFKLIDIKTSKRLKDLRYKTYILEKELFVNSK